nr:hypothetical protein KS05_28170 [Rhizobium brockwellii]
MNREHRCLPYTSEKKHQSILNRKANLSDRRGIDRNDECDGFVRICHRAVVVDIALLTGDRDDGFVEFNPITIVNCSARNATCSLVKRETNVWLKPEIYGQNAI